MKNLELLAPSGNFDKLKTALYFGADAVYAGGKNLSLRALGDNFDFGELIEAVDYTHKLSKKFYLTVNIFARNSDFGEAEELFGLIKTVPVDGLIISDPGIISLALKHLPDVPIHISTQANVTNKYAAKFWADCGVRRIILARELKIDEIKEISDYLGGSVELEAFVHGAACISYSGRCLLSDYFTGRSSNRGECVQACRWNYSICEKSRCGDYYDVLEDERGTYILNSKDLNLSAHIDELAKAGVSSFKIEGRMKSEYYVATVVNAYHRLIESYLKFGSKYKENSAIFDELMKIGHRDYTSGFAFDDGEVKECFDSSQSLGTMVFTAVVRGYDEEKGEVCVEMRNRFFEGDELEILSPSEAFNRVVTVRGLRDESGNKVGDAKIVQQILFFDCPVRLNAGDILRKRVVA